MILRYSAVTKADLAIAAFTSQFSAGSCLYYTILMAAFTVYVWKPAAPLSKPQTMQQ